MHIEIRENNYKGGPFLQVSPIFSTSSQHLNYTSTHIRILNTTHNEALYLASVSFWYWHPSYPCLVSSEMQACKFQLSLDCAKMLSKNHRARDTWTAAQHAQRPVTILSLNRVPWSVLVVASVKKVLFATK